jgi:hypothetical protein
MKMLESWVSEAFSGVPNNGLPPDDFKKFANISFNTSEFKKMYWVKPVKDMCEVSIGLIFSLSFVNLCFLLSISRKFSSPLQS